MYFAAARQLPDRLNLHLHDNLTTLVLDLSHAHHCRVAAIQALLTISEHCSLQGINLTITGASNELKQLVHSMGVRLPLSTKTIKLTLSSEGDE